MNRPASVDLKVNLALSLVREEYLAAIEIFPPFHSAHEGYAVILEELDELWDAIKDKHATTAEIKREAIQVGAMALRFLIDMKGETDE